MEVTTVSPSPASPTEGDDLCETDVTNMAIHSVTLLVGLCGLAGNGAVIGLLNLKSENKNIFNLAVIDFLFLLFTVPSTLLFLVEDMSCSPIVPLVYVSFLFQMSVVSCYWWLFCLMFGIILVFIEELCKLCCRRDLPEELDLVVTKVSFWAFSSLFTVIPTVTFLCSSQEQEHCQAALITVWIIILLLLAVPITVIIIPSIVTIIIAMWGSQQHQLVRGDIIIDFTGLFPLLLMLCNFLQQLGYIHVPSQVFFLLTCIQSSIKPFIYFLAGRCWWPCSLGSLRLSLQRVFEEPEQNTACSNDPAMDTMI